MSFFRKQTAAVVEDNPTTQDILADAHKDFKIADGQYADACFQLAQYHAQSRTTGLKTFNGQTIFQIDSDTKRLALASAVAHALHKRNTTMAKLADLTERYASNETRCIAGVPVRSHA
jgi:hypothetical protein